MIPCKNKRTASLNFCLYECAVLILCSELQHNLLLSTVKVTINIRRNLVICVGINTHAWCQCASDLSWMKPVWLGLPVSIKRIRSQGLALVTIKEGFILFCLDLPKINDFDSIRYKPKDIETSALEEMY